MKVTVTVRLRADILDAGGKAIESSLKRMGFENVAGVRQGKIIEIEFPDGTSLEDAKTQVSAMAEKLLANPVMEEWAVAFSK